MGRFTLRGTDLTPDAAVASRKLEDASARTLENGTARNEEA